MKSWLKFAFALITLAEPALAQEWAIRSGDHPTFSRLTIPVPASQPWNATQTTIGVEIVFPGFTGEFNTSEVFSRMRSDRIRDIEVGNGSLNLRVDCACDATAFRSGPLLVIDIADSGTQLAGPPIEGVKEREQSEASKAAISTQLERTTLPWIGRRSPLDAVGTDQLLNDDTIVNEDMLLARRANLLNQTQENLTEEIARAASIGLLETSYNNPAILSQLAEERTGKKEVLSKKIPDILAFPSNNVRITSSMDLPIVAGSNANSTNITSTSCPKSDFLAVQEWGNEAEFSAQIGPARHALMNARDQLDKEAAKNLAQLYLYFGFGAEAISVLYLDQNLVDDYPHLTIIAEILDGKQLGRDNNLQRYTDCASDVALWASLSFELIPSGVLIDTNAALRALNKLPRHLRQILAPDLSEKLLQYGDAPAASAALRSIERLSEPLGPNALMAQANIKIKAGIPADAFLENVIETNSIQSPEALIKLVEGKLDRDELLSDETATLVEAYAQEFRGTEIGNKLRQTQVIALSQSQHFDEAFAALETLKPFISPNTHGRLNQIIFSQLTDKAPNLVFLEHVFANRTNQTALLDGKTTLRIATRMMDLGFAAKVQQLLAGSSDVSRSPSRQLLAAKAALGLEQPFQAQAALIGIEGPAALLLLAEAKEMAGSYREASLLFSGSAAPEQAAQAAWLSDEWRDLTQSDTPGFGQVANLVNLDASAIDPDLGPLGLANLELQESSSARDTLENLLSTPSLKIESGF